MKLYSYVVARDFGFAPNPFHGYCTLATCKPEIRARAQPGDWVLGTGSKLKGLDGHLVFAMNVTETLTYDQYWNDPRFRAKRPNLRGSLKQAFGDNIYHRDPITNQWIQESSHHSLPDNRPNTANVRHDTRVNRVLISNKFVYLGGEGPKIPKEFRRTGKAAICKIGPGHRSHFPGGFAEKFVSWVQSLKQCGFAGRPKEFDSCL